MIEFKNVSKHFGPTQVLHNIDLNIAQGEVVVIIGPSGSGKSTLLRCINKLEEITSGDLIVDGLKNILYFIKTAGNGQFKAVGDSLEAQQYGIAFPKGSDELRDKVNGALKTLRENGTYNEIYKKWFGTEPK